MVGVTCEEKLSVPEFKTIRVHAMGKVSEVSRTVSFKDKNYHSFQTEVSTTTTSYAVKY